MNTINQFFQVQYAVSQYMNAQLMVSYGYEKRLQDVCTLGTALTSIACILYSFSTMSITVLAWGVGFGAVLFLYALLQNSFLVRLIRYKIVLLIWGNKIEQKVLQVKATSRSKLYTMRSVIEDMKQSLSEWRNTSCDAQSIIGFHS